MPSRSIRWSLSKACFSAPCWPARGGSIALSFATLCLIAAKTALALDDTPDIDLAEDPLAAEFARQFDQRLLVREPANIEEPKGYMPVVAGEDPLPPMIEIRPGTKELPVPTIVPPGEPAVAANNPPEWILFEPESAPLETEWLLYQGQVGGVSSEEQVLAQINRDFAVALEGSGGIELPPWPEDDQTSNPSFEIFETELISPFAPIPELDELPFPDA